jgi:hypothetical protein
MLASTEDQPIIVLEQPNIEIEMRNKFKDDNDVTFEGSTPLTPVIATDEPMSPPEELDENAEEDWASQYESLTTANREALRGLQIEAEEK